MVVGEYTECDGGDPAVILSRMRRISGAGKFCVYPHTGVCERCDVGRMARSYFSAHGGEEGTGFRVFHYQDSVGYQNANMEFMDDMDENFCGRRIIADNFIDDMDKGNYLTLREPPLSGN